MRNMTPVRPTMDTQEKGTMNMKNKRSKLRPARGAAVWTVALSVPLLAACDIQAILEVDIPGRVEEGALDNPKLASTLVTGVVSDVECSWNQFTAGMAHHSDEYIPTSGNLDLIRWGERRIENVDVQFSQGLCGGGTYPTYTPLQTARFQGEDVLARLGGETFSGLDGLADLQAVTRTWGTFPLIALGEAFCEMTIPTVEGEPGPLMTKQEVLTVAENKFSEAISMAQAAGNTAMVNTALVGRARVRIGLENYSGAMADAAQVPAGFETIVTRDASESRRWNYYYDRPNALTGFRQHGSVSDHYRHLTIDAEGRPTQDDGVPDMRVHAVTNGEPGSDFVPENWFHDKYNSRADPLPLVTYKEARMYMAEAAARTGDIAMATELINERRMAAGLPAMTAPASQSEMVELVIEERRRELFVEGAHRFNDMIRFRGTQFEIPFLGEPGSIHPNGISQKGDVYGTTTCLPLPLVEKNGNPNIP